MLSRRRRVVRDRAAVSADAGFTIIEMSVAMFVVAIALVGLMTVQVRSIAITGLAGQRQDATALGNRVMEQLRALPYGTVTGGMLCSDITPSDPNLTTTVSGSACTATFHPSYDSTVNETVKTTTGTQIAPLNPHVQPTTGTVVGPVTYDVRDYLTYVNTTLGDSGGYWLTVVVSWSSAASKGKPIAIGTRSELYSPTGCLATTTHPFSGPCQAFHYSDAGAKAANIVVQSSDGISPLVTGLTATQGSVVLGNSSARTQSEQVVSAQSDSTPSALKLVTLTGTSTAGGVAATSAADTDPSTGTANSPAAASTASQTSPSSLLNNGGGTTFQLTDSNGDTGSTYSTMTAAAAPACYDTTPTALSTNQACSSSTITPSGTASAQISLNALGARNMTLADSAPGTAPLRAYGARFVTPASGHCAAATGVGCVAAGVSRNIGTSHAGGLATLQTGDKIYNTAGSTAVDVTSAVGATPLVTLTGYTDTATSESGLGAGTSSGARTGTLSYWNGSAFASVNLASAGSGTYTVPPTTGQYGVAGTSVTISGTVTVTAPGAPATGTSPCATAACGVIASGGTVVTQLTYVVSTATTTLGSFTVTLDLGSALAQTSYKAAPSA